MGKMEYRVLDYQVLAVAKEGAIGDWAVYIGAVAGINHEEEAKIVAERGTKLPKAIAEMLFPNWRKLEWRD